MPQDFFIVLNVSEVIRHLTSFAPLPTENVALSDTLEGRVLANDVIARDDVPLTNRSAMDGYAVIAADTFGASENNPSYLSLAGEVPVDKPAAFTVTSGKCAGIVTGATLPEGADAVVMIEHTAVMNSRQGERLIEIRRPAAPGTHVLERGIDAKRDTPALRKGVLLRAQEIGLLAAIGAESVCVYARPRVGILSTGDEIIPVSNTPKPGQVRDVNSYALAALCRAAGATPRFLGIVPDDQDAISSALLKHLNEVDALLLSGGSSVGARDFTIAALRRLPNTEIICHGVAMAPGKPLILANSNGKCVFGLPGQVTSAQVVMFVLGQPFLQHLSGRTNAFEQSLWPKKQAILSRNIAAKQGREDYVRVRLENAAAAQDNAQNTDLPLAVPVPGLSGLLRTLLDAHGLVRIDANLEGLSAESIVEVLLF